MGVGWALRKAGAMTNNTVEISEEGGKIRINTQSTVKSSNILFPYGTETDEQTMDGRQVKVT